MKFFIDTANLAQIREAHELGILDGVTTNPSLMAKEGIRGQEAVMNHYKTICEMVDGDISAEVISTDFDSIVEEGKKLAAIHPNIVVKVPMIKDGVKALKWFTDNGIKTNCTLVFSAASPISVNGCLSRPSIESSGQVQTSAPASAHFTICSALRIDAARISVLYP